MRDIIIKGTAKEGQVRVIGIESTNLVNEAAKIHNCTATAAAALGRSLTGGAILGSMLKSNKDSVTLQINGGGPAKGIVVAAYNDGRVKGYIGNPNVELPLNSRGKLNVGGAVGKDGNLYVIRDMGLKEPYLGQVPIFSGEIAEDLAYYFTTSEQTPSAVALGVLVDKDLSIRAAGGFIIQMMPEADELLADMITYRLEDSPSVTDMMAKGMSIVDILNNIFEDMDLKILEESKPFYQCDCSKEKVERALISIGEKDLKEIYEEGKSEELSCNFCNEKYIFTHEDIGEILRNKR